MTTITSNAPFRGALNTALLVLNISNGVDVVQLPMVGHLSAATKKVTDKVTGAKSVVPKAQTWMFDGSIDIPLVSGQAKDVLPTLTAELVGHGVLKQGTMRTGVVYNEDDPEKETKGGNLIQPLSLVFELEGQGYTCMLDLVGYPRKVTDENGVESVTPVIAANGQAIVRPAKKVRAPKQTATVGF